MANNVVLRPVETHIRIMGKPEAFNVTTTSVQLHSNPSETFPCTRVHSLSELTSDFYSDTVKRVVHSALGGQSYTVLVCGPAECGRSQTLYGHGSQKGLVQLVAEELLSHPDAPFVTHCSYNVVGNEAVDAITDQPITLREFGPPLGTVAQALMKSLDHAECATVIPKKKRPDSTNFTSFQIYRCIENAAATTSRKDIFSQIQLVDLAPFSCNVTPPDVQALTEVVANVTSGRDPLFSRCFLTKLLENSMVGSAALMCVATIIGRSDFELATSATLRFLAEVRRISQVPCLVHTLTPKCWDSFPAIAGDLDRADQSVCDQSYQAGLQAAHTIMAACVQNTLTSAHERVQQIQTGISEQRTKQRSEIAERIATLTRRVEQCRTEADSTLKAAQKLNAENSQSKKIARDDEAEAQALINEKKRLDQERVNVEAASRVRVNAALAASQKRAREYEGVTKDKSMYQSRVEEVETQLMMTGKKVAEIHAACSAMNRLEELQTKKRRLEVALETASSQAQQLNEQNRLARERKSKLSTVTRLEVRVSQMRTAASQQPLDPVTEVAPPVMHTDPLASLPSNTATRTQKPKRIAKPRGKKAPTPPKSNSRSKEPTTLALF